MMKAPLPLGKTVFEISRIELYQLLGSYPEACFDDLIGLAAQMSGTPIAFLSLIDSSRHWLKSQLGIDRTLAHRYLNFCDRARSQNSRTVGHQLKLKLGIRSINSSTKNVGC